MITPVTSIRLPEDLKAALEKQADKEGRSVSNLIIYALSCYLKSNSSDQSQSD